jgi:hypothetical protein
MADGFYVSAEALQKIRDVARQGDLTATMAGTFLKILGRVGELSAAGQAVAYVQRFGIYAVPGGEWPDVAWFPRLNTGHDPDLEWLIQARPEGGGWPTWESAVVSLGEHLVEKGIEGERDT